MDSILRSIGGDGKVQVNGELYNGRAVSLKKDINIRRCSQGRAGFELGLGDVALSRREGEGTAFQEQNDVPMAVGIRVIIETGHWVRKQ